MEELYRKLEKYRDSDYYPFHMPGHKRNREAAEGALAESYGLDITEIEGFDNLHQAQGILMEEQKRAARLYGSGQSYFLVNGSTCGILSAVFAVTEQGGKILMARNCHKSVYHAVYLRELETVYLQPGMAAGKSGENLGISGGIEPEAAAEALREHPDCRAVIVTSPTYEGIVSDIRSIADIVHSYGIPLIVDEAHGAHFGFHEAYPASSTGLGADLVIHSVHKTLPAMTQTALLHWMDNGHGNSLHRQEKSLVDKRKLEKYLKIFQTSSPSYVLMASVSRCMGIVEKEGRERLNRLLKSRCRFLERIKECFYVRVFDAAQSAGNTSMQCDPCKLVIGIRENRLTGQELYDILLEKYHLQMEMASAYYVLAIMTMMDTQEGWTRLAEALIQIDDGLKKAVPRQEEIARPEMRGSKAEGYRPEAEQRYKTIILNTEMTISEAYDAEYESVKATDSAGRIAAEFINLYPPGIPLAVPGERLAEAVTEGLMHYQRCGLHIQGVENGRIRVVKEK